MPGRADALREMAAITAVLGQMPGQRPAPFWLEVARIVCLRHGVSSLRGDSEVTPAPKPRMPKRRREIVTLASQGMATKQIAHKLGLSEKTIKRHLALARQDVGATNTTHTVALALRAGLID